MAATPPLLEIRDLTKRFGGAAALRGVSAALARGEILGVMGGNGAGKTTLLNVLAGVHQPDGGHIFWEGHETVIADAPAAAALRIALVPPEPVLADSLTVAENVFLGREPARLGVLVDRATMVRRTRELLDSLGSDIDPAAPAGTLSRAQRQMTAIARALALDPVLLLLDDPTGPLRPQDTDRLFELLGDRQARGLGIVYVSDRFAEIEALATRVLVLRDGRVSGERDRTGFDRTSVNALLVGGDLDLPIKEMIEPGLEMLRVDALRTARFPAHALDFSVREGEVVGLAGLVGAGRTGLLRVLFGLEHAVSGSVFIGDTRLPGGDPSAAIAAGAAFVPHDRRTEGLVLGLSLRENLTLPSLRRLAPAGFVNDEAVTRLAAMMNEHLAITGGDLDQPVGELAAGQQQKAAIARWLALTPKVVLFDEPTRGVDVAARAEIYEAMERLAERGAAVLFASSDMDELLRIADRLLVMRDGRLAGSLTRDDDFSERGIMHLAAL